MSTAGALPIGVILPNRNAFDVFPSHGQAHADYLRGFATCVEARGAHPRDLLAPYDLEPESLEQSGQHLSCQTVVELLESSSRKTNDSLLGFRLAEFQEPEILGCAIPLARAAPDFGSAIEQLITYLPHTHSREAHMELLVGRQSAELRWFSPVEVEYCEQAYYHHLFITYKLLRMLAGRGFGATRTSLRCGVRAPDLDTMSTAMGCVLHAQSGANMIAFDRELLRRPLRTANGVVFDILRNSLEAIISATSDSIVERVRAFLAASLARGRSTLEDCASELRTSSRTLQKRLTEQGTTFSELVEQTKIEKARQSLAIKSLPICEIALDLGYSEHSCFTRAFKRWTGQTPEEFRQRSASATRRYATGS
jgi:AraC-like DNA-binding protein